MKSIRNFLGVAIDKIENWIVVGSYFYFCAIILVEVVRRYIFGNTSQWGGMSARYAFILLVYVAMAQVARTRDHVRVDLIPQKLGDKGRLALYLYIDILHLILIALVCFYSIKVMGMQIEFDTLMTGADINMAYAQAALPIGWGLLGIRVIQRSVSMVSNYSKTGLVKLMGSSIND